MDTKTLNVLLKVIDPADKRNSKCFHLKGFPYLDTVSKVKNYILNNYQDETKVTNCDFEIGYYVGKRRFNISNEVQLAEAYSLEKGGSVILWIDDCSPKKRKLEKTSRGNNKKTCLQDMKLYYF
jgi:hypothetical protein